MLWSQAQAQHRLLWPLILRGQPIGTLTLSLSKNLTVIVGLCMPQNCHSQVDRKRHNLRNRDIDADYETRSVGAHNIGAHHTLPHSLKHRNLECAYI
ncbi:hypothetical protein C8Q70DRAFT_344402 [Cubamyces menziesii]|nr:hypothetical protein C8Q70DRAFT_344402 [Cubamyces menziesii]